MTNDIKKTITILLDNIFDYFVIAAYDGQEDDIAKFQEEYNSIIDRYRAADNGT